MPKKPTDLTGKRYGMITVVEMVRGSKSPIKWGCICDCGNKTEIPATLIIREVTMSCGCFRSKSKITHNGSKRRDGTSHPLYSTWLNMRKRCNNKNSEQYKYYGAKGVKVCKEWDDFAVFVKDMGERPAGHSIDRIDGSKNYCKENCRWASGKEQARNRSNTLFAIIDGEKKPVSEWCEINGINYKTAEQRLSRGWCKECACTIPSRSGGCPHQKSHYQRSP